MKPKRLTIFLPRHHKRIILWFFLWKKFCLFCECADCNDAVKSSFYCAEKCALQNRLYKKHKKIKFRSKRQKVTKHSINKYIVVKL